MLIKTLVMILKNDSTHNIMVKEDEKKCNTFAERWERW